MAELRTKPNRIWELDFFRGFAIIMVVFDHAMVAGSYFYMDWTYLGIDYLVEFAKLARAYLPGDLRIFWRPVFLFIFFFVSGICTAFSKNNFGRALKIAGAACFVTWATYVFEMIAGEGYFILWGVLHCFALIMIIYAILEGAVKLIFWISSKIIKKPLKTAEEITLAVICIALAVLVYFLNEKYNVSIYGNEYVQTDKKFAGMFVYTYAWATADYFPIMPFIGYFLLGAGMSRLLYSKKRTLFPHLDGMWNKPFALAGRLSLLIYVFCQVIVFSVLALLTYISSGVFLFG